MVIPVVLEFVVLGCLLETQLGATVFAVVLIVKLIVQEIHLVVE